MSPIHNARIMFTEIPKGAVDPSTAVKYDASETIDLDAIQLQLTAGEFLCKILALSVEPYLCAKMLHVNPFIDNLQIGEPVFHYGVSIVLSSENKDIKVGDHLYGMFPFQEYTVKNNAADFRILSNPNSDKVPWSAYLGICGMPGQTAYYGWKEYAKAKQGETIFVTTGAGPIGALIIQLAKREGLKVIASAGTDDKVAYMRSIGADIPFNYKTTDTRAVLKDHGPIDIYWDHVGGEVLDIALENAARFARFVEVGMIAQLHNPSGTVTMKNLPFIILKTISMNGYIVTTLDDKYRETFYKEIPSLVATGELTFAEERSVGLQETGKAIGNVYTSTHKAKSVIIVADE